MPTHVTARRVLITAALIALFIIPFVGSSMLSPPAQAEAAGGRGGDVTPM